QSGARPRRTILFQLWSGEEQGLLGSRAWIDRHPEALDGISGVFVFDGGPNAIAGIDSTAEMFDSLQKVFEPVIGLNPDLPFEIRKRDGLGAELGSDHASFLQKGIPGFFWTQDGRADWRHGIHTQFDTFDLAIPEYLEHSATVVALTALGVANLDQKLSRENLRAQRGDRGGGRRMGVFLDGVAVEELVPDSVAEKAGVQAGDVFVKIDGKAIEDRQALVAAIRDGGPVKKVVVRRGDKEVEVTFEWKDEIEAEKKKQKEEEKPVIL
ncbi:MAG: M28 family peptidase, partial [Planctomycetes bacterium]|nr:M28 family peptidase [Planctomycetota bacterium]